MRDREMLDLYDRMVKCWREGGILKKDGDYWDLVSCWQFFAWEVWKLHVDGPVTLSGYFSEYAK